MRHPVRNVNVNAVNSGGGDLANALHVLFAPGFGVRANPDVFVAFANPERSAAGEDGGLTRDFALEPIGMIFDDRVGGLFGIRSDAFSAGDVDEGLVASFMRFFGDGFDGSEFFGWVEKTFVAARKVVVNF